MPSSYLFMHFCVKIITDQNILLYFETNHIQPLDFMNTGDQTKIGET